MTWLLLVLLAVLVALEVPVSIALIAGTLLYLTLDPGIPLMVVVQRVASGLESYVLLAIPLFILAGNLLSSGGIANRIYDFAVSMVGHIKGSLAHVNVVGSVIFAGMSGVAQADAAGLGAVETRQMKRHGFKPEFAAAITSVSAVIGPIIPPSGIMIIYAVLADVSVPHLFLAGFIPGLMMAGFMMITIYVLVRAGMVYAPEFRKATLPERLRAAWRALPALVAPVMLVGGLLTGIATPTQLGALTVVYAIILGFAWTTIRCRPQTKRLVLRRSTSRNQQSSVADCL
jgi:TRAP-type transport system large permease protein